MKRPLRYMVNDKLVEKEVNYIPVRYIIAFAITALEVLAVLGTVVTLCYRSLVHHFENGVWMYHCDSIADLKKDMEVTLEKSIPVTKSMLKTSLMQRFICAVVRIFAPML